jgi:Adenosine-deaminase (editase) domain
MPLHSEIRVLFFGLPILPVDLHLAVKRQSCLMHLTFVRVIGFCWIKETDPFVVVDGWKQGASGKNPSSAACPLSKSSLWKDFVHLIRGFGDAMTTGSWVSPLFSLFDKHSDPSLETLYPKLKALAVEYQKKKSLLLCTSLKGWMRSDTVLINIINQHEDANDDRP